MVNLSGVLASLQAVNSWKLDVPNDLFTSFDFNHIMESIFFLIGIGLHAEPQWFGYKKGFGYSPLAKIL